MKWSVLVLMACVLAVSASASVMYNTTGDFNCANGSFTDSVNNLLTDTISGCGVSSTAITLTGDSGLESITLSFSGIGNTVNALSGTVAPYGSITASCSGTGCVTDAVQIGLPPGILSLTVTIAESTPDSSSKSAGTAGLSGPIAFDSSSLAIGSYSLSPLTISGTDNVTYSLDASDTLNAPSETSVGGNGVTGLQMTITDQNAIQSTAPEPATFALMGAGLMALGLISRRSR